MPQSKKRASLQSTIEAAGTQAADQIGQMMDKVGEGKVVVVVPVILVNAGTIVLNRELDLEGGDTET
jgi:hypothetical protein